MSFICGDPYCPSCGTAQGTYCRRGDKPAVHVKATYQSGLAEDIIVPADTPVVELARRLVKPGEALTKTEVVFRP